MTFQLMKFVSLILSVGLIDLYEVLYW